MGNMVGGAKAELQKYVPITHVYTHSPTHSLTLVPHRLVIKSGPLFKSLSARFKKKGKIGFVANGKYTLTIHFYTTTTPHHHTTTTPHYITTKHTIQLMYYCAYIDVIVTIGKYTLNLENDDFDPDNLECECG